MNKIRDTLGTDGNCGNHGNAQDRLEFLLIYDDILVMSHIPHVKGENHGQPFFNQFQYQVEPPLYLCGIYHADDQGIRVVPEHLHGNLFCLVFRFKGKGPGYVDQLYVTAELAHIAL